MSQVQLRPVTMDDMKMILEWRNTPFILSRSTSPEPISAEEHQAWFERALGSRNVRMSVVMIDGTPAGTVRFERKAAVAVISVYLVESFTGKGYGVTATREATAAIFAAWPVRKVVACVRTDNAPACKAFARAGYQEDPDYAPYCGGGHVTFTSSRPRRERGAEPTHALAGQPMRVLVIAAHPDDEILGCGGTMARLIQEGHQVEIVILGEGVTSRYPDRAQADPALLAALHADALRAAAELGVERVDLRQLPDNRFDTIPLLEVTKIVEGLVDAHNPDVIFTHHQSDLNVDHQVTFRAVLTATRPIEGHSVRDLYAFEIASSTEWGFHAQQSFHPNVFVDISSTLERKKRAMRQYKSELREFPHPRSLQALDVIARRWGSVAGCQAAEAFQLVRSIRLDGDDFVLWPARTVRG